MQFKNHVMPKVFVIVLNWNGRDNTIECLDSLLELTYSNFKIIVVDNSSTDGSYNFIKDKYSQIEIIQNSENLGFGEGFNVGIRAAIKKQADYVLCLNNDVIVDNRILNELVKAGELNVDIGGLCPLELSYYQPDRIICAGGVVGFARGKLNGFGEIDKGQYNKIVTTGLLSGPAMMIKLSALNEVGLFDKNYFYGPEDQDIALKLLRKGYRILFVPKAKLWHKRRGATNGKITPLNDYFHIRNYLLFVKKNATKTALFFSLLYFGFIDYPLTFFKRLVFGKRKNLKAMMQGLIWHINSKLVPSDSQIIELFTKV